jgi:hypothetical protein
MPAKSKAQQRLMGMAHAIQTGELSPSASPAAAKIARTMKPGDVEEFASTKLKGLPEKKNPEKKRPKRPGNPGPPKPPGETMSKPSPNPELGPPLPPAPPSPPEAPPAKPGPPAKPPTIPKRTMGGILSDLRRARRTR